MIEVELVLYAVTFTGGRSGAACKENGNQIQCAKKKPEKQMIRQAYLLYKGKKQAFSFKTEHTNKPPSWI